MDGLYAESRAKKRVTGKDNAVKFGLIAGIILSVIAGLLIPYVLFFALVFGVLAYYFLPRLETEYEYVFCDGQLDFDKISGGIKRKNLLRVDFDQMVVVAPKNSHALDGYRHNGVEVRDYSSLYEDHRIYGIVITGGEKSQLIYFEPDDKMLAAMKQKAPRKIVEY